MKGECEGCREVGLGFFLQASRGGESGAPQVAKRVEKSIVKKKRRGRGGGGEGERTKG